MQFPIYNIDTISLGEHYWLLQEIIRYDEIYSSHDEDIWRKYFLNKRFVDSQGDVYRLVDKSKVKKSWYALLGTAHYRCHFAATGERLSVGEVCKVMEQQVRNTHEKFEEEIINDLRMANTFTELISWESVDFASMSRL